jgi:hypothetical protein
MDASPLQLQGYLSHSHLWCSAHLSRQKSSVHPVRDHDPSPDTCDRTRTTNFSRNKSRSPLRPHDGWTSSAFNEMVGEQCCFMACSLLAYPKTSPLLRCVWIVEQSAVYSLECGCSARSGQTAVSRPYGSQDCSVGIATGYRLDGGRSIPGRDKRFFSSPLRPDQLWDPPSLLWNE